MPAPNTTPAILLAALTAPLAAQAWLPPSPFPAWGGAAPAAVTIIHYDPLQSSLANGARLHAAIAAMTPGRALAVGPGTWSISARLDLSGSGTASMPFFLVAANPAQRPVITRPDANQNAINVGSNAPARYWVLRGLEITGGSDLIKLYDCAEVWIDDCYLHDGHGVGISAQTRPCSRLWITRNEIARPGPGTTGEGMYLGGGSTAVAVTDSVIAFNRVHSTRGAIAGQGDGIELKQGCHRDWLLANTVHACQNPCILVYGTGGNGQNAIDGNLCYDSDDVVLQVQGEAIVRDNIAIGGSLAFGSHDHQAASTDLQFVHNTLVNRRRAASMAAWNGRANMVFANNVVYSLGAESIWFGNGSAGVQLAGNVVLGPTVNVHGGCVAGAGLGDFADVTLDTFHLDVRPVVGGAIDNRGSPQWLVAIDREGTWRDLPVDPGAVTNAAALRGAAATIALATGGVQPLVFEAPPLAGASYVLLGSLSGTTPGQRTGGFTLPLQADAWFAATLDGSLANVLWNGSGTVDAAGRAATAVVLPPLPAALRGLVLHHAMIALRGTAVAFVSNAVPLTLQ